MIFFPRCRFLRNTVRDDDEMKIFLRMVSMQFLFYKCSCFSATIHFQEIPNGKWNNFLRFERQFAYDSIEMEK